MTLADLMALLPLLIPSVAAVLILVVLAFYRGHRLTTALAAGALVLSLLAIPPASRAAAAHRQVTDLLVLDGYAFFFLGLILSGSLAVVLLSHGYLARRAASEPAPDHPEEFYVLLLLATVGAGVLAASSHFASLFLGLEILTVSLYGLIAYERGTGFAVEAALKYLVLAAVSAAFLLFGMALIYAETGSMALSALGGLGGPGRAPGETALLLTGLAMMTVGIGFKLALVPFHLWTADVYEGAPAPVTAFIATVSKGAVFALLLRFFAGMNVYLLPWLWVVAPALAALSMTVGNLLALQQTNLKRLLAYSSISHLGYLMVAFLAAGAGDLPGARAAAQFYLAAYFVTVTGAFGVITVLSGRERDADSLEDYRGLAWRRPALAAVLTAMLLSLAGIPLTAGFVGKLFVLNAGVGASLWALVILLVANSAVGLYYYLRVVVVVFARGEEGVAADEGEPSPAAPAMPLTAGVALCVLTLLTVYLGVYPAPLIALIRGM